MSEPLDTLLELSEDSKRHFDSTLWLERKFARRLHKLKKHVEFLREHQRLGFEVPSIDVLMAVEKILEGK